jgi:para-aminobenzoate synthetase
MLIYSDRFIAIDHVEGKTYLVAIDDHENANQANEWLDTTLSAVRGAVRGPALDEAQEPVEFVEFRLDRDKKQYLSDVEHCLKLIAQGESYQICLTNEITCRSNIDALRLYRVIRKVNPAPYSAIIKWPGGAVLSASPERFLFIDAEGFVETKPIKGTIERDENPVRDRRLAEDLRTSEKDRAENVMIVDLLRNDLSRCCEPGSVKVPKLFDIESYQTVHQLVSTVRGRLRAGQTAVSVLRHAFPGGSMTGAPKTRTLTFIDELERRPRGVYSGSLGWLGDNGAADLNIVIRTVVVQNGRLSIGVGGGIVAASTPLGEFEEMLLKAQALIKSIVIASTGHFDTRSFRVLGAEPLTQEETTDELGLA